MRSPGMKGTTLAAVLAGVAMGALVAVVVVERGQNRRVALGQYADPAYIHWLGDLERQTGEKYSFANDLTPSSIVELPLGYYRPEVRCHQPPCSSYASEATLPREPETYTQYMEMRHQQIEKEKKKAAPPPPVYDGPVGGIDDHPFDLPTYPGMQDQVRTMFDAPEQCPPCEGARRRLLSGCGCEDE